jgi:hypothetical protein
VVDADERAVAPGAELQRLNRVRAVADRGEHLRAGEDELDRPSDRACGEHREGHVGPYEQAGAEAAADVRREHADGGRRDRERRREECLEVRRPLGRVVDRDGVAVPGRHGRKRAERVVRVVRGRVGRLVRDFGGCERGVDVSASGVGAPRVGLQLAARVADVEHRVGFLVGDVHETRRRGRLSRRLGDHDRDDRPEAEAAALDRAGSPARARAWTRSRA